MPKISRVSWIAIVLGIMVLASGPLALAAGAGMHSSEGAIPDGFLLVSENATLELYLNPDATQFIVFDKRNGKVWRTNPPGPHTDIASALWQTHAQSQITFSYTDAKKRQIKETDPLSEGATVSYEPIKDGVRVVYTMKSRGFTIATDYTLGPDFLEVRIPDSELKETDQFMIVYLELLPFFGAATDQEDGYMVFPDSSGAIAPFTPEHGRYAKQFEEYVYGPEEYPFIEYSPLRPVNRQVPMPVFGLKHTDGAYLGVIVDGEYDAKVVAAPSGYIVDYYRANPKFVVRREYLAPLRQDANVQTVEGARIKTDRAVRYYLLPKEQASYTGMALRYREHLIETLGLQPGQVAGDDGIAPIHIRLFQSVLEDRIIFDNLLVLTTFPQAKEIVDSLQSLGVKEMDVTLVGWNKNGYAGRVPRRFPVEGALGGARALKDFTGWAADKGIKVYLQDNFIDAYDENRGFSTRTDVVRDPSKLPIRGFERVGIRKARERYLLSPLIALRDYATRDIPKEAKLGAAGIDFERFGWTLISDRNNYGRAERAGVAKAWTKIIQLSNKEMQGSIVQGGNVYMLPYVDKVERAPMTETTHLFAKRSVPFYQIAVHGIVPYYGWPGNLRSEPQREFLKNVEYGALPVFELTYKDSSMLKRADRYNILFSSQYDIWKERVLQEYKDQGEEMGYLQDVAIVDHKELAKDVFQTTYEDGSRVIVNYRTSEWRDGDLVVKPLDFVLIGGGISE